MKKLSKFALGIAAFLVMAGGMLAVSGWAMGADTSIEYNVRGWNCNVSPFGFRGGTERSVSVERSVSLEQSDVTFEGGTYHGGSESLAPFSDVSVNVSLANVLLQPGDGYGVELNWNDEREQIYYSVDGGMLTVWDEWEGDNHNTKKNATVVVTYPASAQFNGVDLYSGLGTIEASGFTASSVNVDADLGAVILRELKTRDMDLSLSLGELKGSGLEVSGDTWVNNDLGSVTLDGAFHGMDLSCSMGGLTVNTSLPRSDYNWDLGADMGSISLDGRTGDWDDTLSGGGGSNSIYARCDMGSLSLTFGG